MSLSCCSGIDKFDGANSLGGIGPVATFQGPLINPKLGLLPLQAGAGSHLPSTIPELDILGESPLHTPRSAGSATSMKSALSTMHPASISGAQSMHSRRTSALGEHQPEEFEDVFDADDLELGNRSDREDASLLHSNVSRQSLAHSSSSEPHAHMGGELSDRHENQPAWAGVFQNPAVVRFGQATKSLGSKLRGKYAEYRETHL